MRSKVSGGAHHLADALNQFIKNGNSLRTDWPYRVVGHFDLRFEWYRHHFGTGRTQAGMIHDANAHARRCKVAAVQH